MSKKINQSGLGMGCYKWLIIDNGKWMRKRKHGMNQAYYRHYWGDVRQFEFDENMKSYNISMDKIYNFYRHTPIMD